MNQSDDTKEKEDMAGSKAGAPPFLVAECDRHGSSKPEGGDAVKLMLDRTRFDAGLAEFYKTVLKEPLPGRMQELMGKIAKSEIK